MKKYLLLSLIFCVLLLTAFPADLAAQKKKKARVKRLYGTPVVELTAPATDTTPGGRRQEAFEKAWATINDGYFDKTFGGLDWAKVYLEFQPKVKAAKTDFEFHRLLKEMISRLGKSHLNIITPEYFESIETAKKQARQREKELAAEKKSGSNESDEADDEDESSDPALMRYGIGVELKVLDGKMVIARIDAKSGAAVAALKPGYVIDKINGVALSNIFQQALLNGATTKELRYLLPLAVIESFLNGPQDTSVQLTCLDESDKPKEFTVPRLRLAGEVVTISKNMPEQFLKYESRSLGPEIGYIKFNTFAIPVIGKFCDSLTEFAGKKAMIIDLRGNIGGIIGTMIGLSGMLTDVPVTLGILSTRAGKEPFLVAPKKKHFKGKVVVLVDGDSLSAAEMFSSGLRDNGALVVGERTAGASLPSVWVKLPTGAVMLYPIADFIRARGTSLEGVGLEPDKAVIVDRQTLLRGEDIQLKEAIALAGDEKAFVKKREMKLEDLPSGATGDAPPPPPRKATPKLAPTPDPAPASNDERALKTISDFAAAAGGIDAIKRIVAYEAKGTMATGGGNETEAGIYAARQFPDKFVLVLNSPAAGEVREIYNGKASFLQADYGIDRDLYTGFDTTRFHLLAPLFDVLEADYLRGLKYEGEFEVEGRKRQVLSAVDPKGFSIGISFDSATKLLVSYSKPGAIYALADYRKVDNVMLPFKLDVDRGFKMTLSSITINPKLDAGTFEKKEKCFDKAD